MIKLRLTFVDDEEGVKELKRAIELLEATSTIVSKSKVYKGRVKSLYSNIYLDIKFNT